MVVRGIVLHCSRFGAVVRLDDGRLAMYPCDEPGMHTLRRAATGGRRPSFPFDVADKSARRVRLSLVDSGDTDVEGRDVVSRAKLGSGSTDIAGRAKLGSDASLEQKIIDYLRQTAEWDPRASNAPAARGDEPPRADRLLPFELRARRQYRESAERPKRRRR